MRGYHGLARMGAEAAGEEEVEAAALEANVIGSVRSTHASPGFGYYSPEETRELRRKSYEDSLSTAQREGLMTKLLAQLYHASDTLGAEEDESVDNAIELFASSSALFGGDLDSVFGEDCAERMGAVTLAALTKARRELRSLRKKIRALPKGPAKDRMRAKAQLLRAKIKTIRSSLPSIGAAEDARESVDTAELSLFGRLTDYGAEDRVAVMASKFKTMTTQRVKAIANDPFRKAEVREAARAELVRREEEGDEEAVDPKAKRLRAMVEKFKTLPVPRLQAIVKDPLRRKDVRAAARAELVRRAKTQEASEDAAEAVPEESAEPALVATPPQAFTEEGYLSSYRGVTPARRRFVQHFQARAARLGADDPAVLAAAAQVDDSYGGFFQALGEFFRNLFTVGGRDSRRIEEANEAGRLARQKSRKDLEITKLEKAMSEAQLTKLKYAFSKADTAEDRAEIQKKIDALRPALRIRRAAVRDAGKKAFEKSFDASRPDTTPASSPEAASPASAPAFPITGSPILKKGMKDEDEGGLVFVLQQTLNRVAKAGLDEDGNFGPDTTKAVVAFQRAHALNPDGKVGPSTASVLAAAANKA